MTEDHQGDLAFEGCNEDEGTTMKLGLTSRMNPKQFPSANPGGLVNSDAHLGTSRIML